MKITLAHGSGGELTNKLIRDIFESRFRNPVLSEMQDAAVLDAPVSKIAFTTDSFVVSPLFFKGGDIGKLSVCGTVNDLLMRGAVPKYLSAGFILEEGLETDDLIKIASSMRNAAKEAGVEIVAGDTKVINGAGGVYINTSGIGFIETDADIGADKAQKGDIIIISGRLGNHEACILSSRMGIENSIESDCAPLCDMVLNLIKSGVYIHAMRDITRGGLASVLNELSEASNVQIELSGWAEFADSQVSAFCGILGLDPLYMGNEGKFVIILPEKDSDKALNIIQRSKYGKDARIIGKVSKYGEPEVIIKTRSGGTRTLNPLVGEGLPRIC